MLREYPLSPGMFEVFFKKIKNIHLLVESTPLDK
jgi:hypothetical protein